LRNDWPTLVFFCVLVLLADALYAHFPMRQIGLLPLLLGVLITAMSIPGLSSQPVL